MNSIFTYTNYREYLKAAFAEKKKTDKKFSHRQFTKKLGLVTSNFMLLVMQGKRNLNPGLCFKVAEVFKLTHREALYLENMVNLAQAKNNNEKNVYLKRMMALRKNLKISKIDEWQYEYYSNWYNPVIRELICSPNFKGDLIQLSRRLIPSISLTQVKKSVELLLKLKMIKKENGAFIQTSEFISTGPEVNSVAVANFHLAMGRLALDALEHVPKTERNMTASTVFISQNTYEIIKERIEELRQEILTFADADKNADRVYQANFQLFPVSRKEMENE